MLKRLSAKEGDLVTQPLVVELLFAMAVSPLARGVCSLQSCTCCPLATIRYRQWPGRCLLASQWAQGSKYVGTVAKATAIPAYSRYDYQPNRIGSTVGYAHGGR